MADLSVLRTAKLAMAEGLIEQEDFDEIKQAFLRAQQIKAGMDAGFLRQEDFEQARDAFLASLNFRVARGSQLPESTSRPQATNSGNASVSHATTSAAVNGRGGNSHNPSLPTAAAAHAPAAAKPPVNRMQSQPAAFQAAPSFAQPGRLPPAASTRVGGTAHMPAITELVNDLPKIGRVGSAVGKKSMSGISVNEQCINVFNHMKTKSAFKWVIYKIDDAGNDVVVENAGASDSSYSEFTMSLPPLQCRYGVFDYAYNNADTHQTLNKLVFVNWAPDTASTRTKMMYASTKDFFKGFLDGIGAELQATELEDLEEGEMRDRVHAALTRK